jgi:hypothetical protein
VELLREVVPGVGSAGRPMRTNSRPLTSSVGGGSPSPKLPGSSGHRRQRAQRRRLGRRAQADRRRYHGKVSRIYFRADAAFAMPEVYEFLEAERIKYAFSRLRTRHPSSFPPS